MIKNGGLSGADEELCEQVYGKFFIDKNTHQGLRNGIEIFKKNCTKWSRVG